MAINDPAPSADFVMVSCYNRGVNNLTFETRDDKINDQFTAESALYNQQES